MNLKAQYEFLFVGRDEGSFLENYAYNVSEGDVGSTQVFVCLEIQNNPAEAEQIGESVFETFKKSFFSQRDEKDAYVRFENSLKDINRVIDGYREGKSSGHIGRLHMIVAAISGNNLYLSQTGDSEAYLIRKRFVSVVSEGLWDPKDKETFASIANGTLEAGDFVVFSSTRLLRYISKTNLARIASPDVIRSLNDLRETVAPEILGKIGFIGISVTKRPDYEEKNEEDEEMLETSVSSSFAEKFSFLRKLPSFSEIREKIQFKMPFKMPEFSRTGTLGRFASRARERFWSNGMTKDKVLAILIVAILLLTFGIWFVKGKQEKNAEIVALDAKLNEARQQISEAETKGTYDKQTASVILVNAEQQAKQVMNSGYHRAKASEILAAISQTRDLLDDIRRPTYRVLADLSEKESGVNALGLVGMNNRLYVYETNRLFEVVLDAIQKPVTVDAHESIISATSFEERGSVVMFTKSGKIFEFKDGIVRQMATLDGAFRKGVAIEDWSNRLYILDPESDQIWRYPYVKSRDVFGTAEGYKVDGSLKDGVDIAIDANVYILSSKEGALERYYGGSRQSFVVQNSPFTPPSGPTRLYTDGELSFAFVLDSAESKVYVYGKDAATNNFVYRYQIYLDGLTELRDVYFAQTTNQLYVMDSKKIYEITL